jgi:hypothetical protein
MFRLNCHHQGANTYIAKTYVNKLFICNSLEQHWKYPKKTQHINPLKPNDAYRGRTAPQTSNISFYIFIQPIYVLNILNIVYTLRFFLFKMQFVS